MTSVVIILWIYRVIDIRVILKAMTESILKLISKYYYKQ